MWAHAPCIEKNDVAGAEKIAWFIENDFEIHFHKIDPKVNRLKAPALFSSRRFGAKCWPSFDFDIHFRLIIACRSRTGSEPSKPHKEVLMRILFFYLFACLCTELFGCRDRDGEAGNLFADLGQPADLSSPMLDANGPVPLQPPVVCGSELPGPPLKTDVIEAQPGYAAELAALDLTRVPDPFDYRE